MHKLCFRDLYVRLIVILYNNISIIKKLRINSKGESGSFKNETWPCNRYFSRKHQVDAWLAACVCLYVYECALLERWVHVLCYVSCMSFFLPINRVNHGDEWQSFVAKLALFEAEPAGSYGQFPKPIWMLGSPLRVRDQTDIYVVETFV